MAVNITTDINTVKVLATTTNSVKIVDNGNNTSVSVSQPTTQVIKVATVGLTGPQGEQGPSGSNATNQDWILDQQRELSPTEVVVISGDFVVENSTLTLSDSGDSYTYGALAFNKYAKMFIGGNLLVKDSTIENNGLINVAGGVLLIGNSTIIGTGTII